MANIVILKNNTGLQITIEELGISLSASEVYTATDYFEFIDLTEADDLKVYVGDGDITINDGDNDLSIAKGLEHLEIESVHQDYIQDSDGGSVIVSTTQPYSGVIRSTTLEFESTYTTLSYESVEYENDTSVIEWDSDSAITVKEDGDYKISTCFFMRANNSGMSYTYYRIIKNGGTVISNEAAVNTYYTEVQQAVLCTTVPLVAGDYIEVQIYGESGSDIDLMGSRFNITKNSGVKGDDGAPGGTTVNVQQDGVLTQSNVDVLNFRGSGVSTSAGSTGIAYIDINSNTFEPKYIQVYDSNGLVDVNDDTATAIPFNIQEIRDTDTFDHSTSTNNTRISILKTGWFEASWTITYIGDNSRKIVVGALRKNGTTIFERTYGTAYTRNNTDNYGAPSNAGTLVYLTTGDYVELVGFRSGSSGSVETQPNTCRATLKMIREV